MAERWTPFEAATVPPDKVWAIEPGDRMWLNNRYQVLEHEQHRDGAMRAVHLSIKRVDKEPVRDWRDLQRIKNEILGPEAEGVELFPAESRLVDNANQFHLFCLVGAQFPFGFPSRMVSAGSYDGSKQRPWPEGEQPADALSSDEASRLIEKEKRRRVELAR